MKTTRHSKRQRNNQVKTIYTKIDKRLIPTLPKVVYKGRIVVIETRREMLSAVSYLRKQRVLGLDTETRPNFDRQARHKVALLQVAAEGICFLFRLNRLGLPQELTDLLGDDKILKIGLSFQDDLRSMHARADFKMGRYVELQRLVKDYNIQDMSLQKIYANLFGERISKSQRLSNWEADVLSEAQQQYAAIDAWACIRIYQQLQAMKRIHNYRVVSDVNPSLLVDKVIRSLLA
jgi:ribonuclease D